MFFKNSKKLARGNDYSFNPDSNHTSLTQYTTIVKHQNDGQNLEERRFSLNTFSNGQQYVTFWTNFGKNFLINFSWPFQRIFEN